VDEAVVVHMLKTLQNLTGNLASLRLRQGARQVLLQISPLKVFHGYEHRIPGFEPTVGAYEPIGVLTKHMSDRLAERELWEAIGWRQAYPFMRELGDGLELARIVNLFVDGNSLSYFLDGAQLYLSSLLAPLLVDSAECALAQKAVAKPSLFCAHAPPPRGPAGSVYDLNGAILRHDCFELRVADEVRKDAGSVHRGVAGRAGAGRELTTAAGGCIPASGSGEFWARELVASSSKR
jgi:hypothetical protein